MKKSYESFIEELRQRLILATNYPAEQICLKKDGEFPSTEGDRLLLKTPQKEGVYEICALYVEDLYRNYQNGWTMERLVQEILKRLEAIRKSKCFERAAELEDYSKIKGELFIRLLNVERNKKELEDCVYRTIGDIALVLYARMGEIEGCNTSMKIKQNILKKWERNEQLVFENALLNTYFISPPRIYSWEKLFFDEDYEGENFMNLLSDFQMKKDAIGNCLSTVTRTNGAVAVFLPGVANRIGELLHGGFYMVFTSIHEVMIHSDVTANPDDLKELLRETVEDTTPEEDFLTYNIYHYDPESRAFTFF